MKIKTSIFVLSALILACSSSKPTVQVPELTVLDFDNTITQEGLRSDLVILASDSLEGRDTGSEGLKKAADYLANRYRTLGVEPVGDNGSYFQHFDLSQTVFSHVEYSLMDADGALIATYTHSADKRAPFSTLLGGKSELQGGLLFTGYSISNETVNHLPENAHGKWLITFYDRAMSNFSALQNLIGEDKAVGAILIMGTDEDSFNEQSTRMQTEFGQPSDLGLAYLNDDSEISNAFNRVSPSKAIELLGLSSHDELVALEQELKNSPEEFTPRELPFMLLHKPNIEHQLLETKNVISFIEGSDSLLKHEVIVLSSHYDHVGIGTPDSTGDAIYNGADDDGSGTVGLVHVAQALASAKQAGVGLRRSVLFLHVSGEERGLLGSRYYSDHPIFSIENTVANLNVDMIGRRDTENLDNPDYIYVIGGKIISSGLQEILEKANAMSVNIELSDRYNDLEDPNQFYRRSDHWNFGRLGVPFIFFFNGTHADYHRPSDEVEKIDFEALSKRTRLLFTTTVLLANDDDRPIVDNQVFIEKTQEQPR